MYFFTKILFTMMFWVVVAKWSYAEIAKASPALRASVDSLMEIATIPTHDQWDTSKIREFGEKLAENFKVEQAFAGQDE